MRRRSALGVIGGAVAAMATPLFGCGNAPKVSGGLPHYVSSMEMAVRSLILAERMCPTDKTGWATWAFRHIYFCGVGCVTDSTVNVHPNARKSFCLTNTEYDDMCNLHPTEVQQRQVLADLVGKSDLLLKHYRQQSVAVVLGLDDADRLLSRQILAMAVGMVFSEAVETSCRSCFTVCESLDDKDATRFGQALHWMRSDFADIKSLGNAVIEIGRSMRQLQSSVRVSALMQTPVKVMKPSDHLRGRTDRWELLMGDAAQVSYDCWNYYVPSAAYRLNVLHDEPIIDYGFLCPYTWRPVLNGIASGLKNGYLWPSDNAPRFYNTGFAIEVSHTGDDILVGVSTKMWVDPASLGGVIAFAVPKA